MKKFISGFLIGFFLASLLLFGYINMQLSPAANEIAMLKQYSASAYATTHSPAYVNIRQVAVSMKDLSSSIAALPILGGAIDASKISEYSNTITELLDNVKAISESARSFIDTVQLLLNVSLPMIVISVIMLAVGGYMYYQPEEKGGRRAK